MTIPRCETGIAELDPILGGGIPQESMVLVAGPPGTGKTTFCLEFLCQGAARGEPGIAFCAGESVGTVETNVQGYLFFQPSMRDQGLLRFVDLRTLVAAVGVSPTSPPRARGAAILDAIRNAVKEQHARRVVLDSLTALYGPGDAGPDLRGFVVALRQDLQALGCTSLVVSETSARDPLNAPPGVEEFVADGIILLADFERHNDLVRTLQVTKMRGTSHSRARFMLDLSEYGMSLAPLLGKTPDLGAR